MIIITPKTRERIHRIIDETPDGHIFREPQPPTKRRAQEAKYHAMIGDIAKQVPLLGRKVSLDDAKRLLVDAFSRAMSAAGTPLRQTSQILPSLDGTGFVQMGIQTRYFLISEAAEFIEYLYAFGSEHGVVWSEEVDIPGWVK